MDNNDDIETIINAIEAGQGRYQCHQLSHKPTCFVQRVSSEVKTDDIINEIVTKKLRREYILREQDGRQITKDI